MMGKPRIVGGKSEAGPPSEETLALLNLHKVDVEQKLGAKFAHWKPVSGRTQMVNGRNHFVKVDVGGQKHLNVKIYEKLPHQGGGSELKEALYDE